MKCNFYNNKKISSLGNGGGAIAIKSSYITYVNNISNCNFYNNTANDLVINGGYGGAIYASNDPGILNIVNCFFSGNTAEYGGAICTRAGSVANSNSSTVIIKNCIVSGNTATYGGGIFNDQQNTIINNTKVIGNYATQQSGGVYNRYGRPILNSCLITGNKAVNYGGGIYCNEVPTGTTMAGVNNCTISGNYASRGGAIAIISNSNYYLKNSILSGNIANTNGNNLYIDSSGCTMNLDYCQYTTGVTDNFNSTGGVFNITNCTTSDPKFVNPIIPTTNNTPNTLGDYRIKGTSPCVNTGYNNNVSIPIDIRGQQRKIGNSIYNLRDLGPAGGLIFYINPNYLNDGWTYLEAYPQNITPTGDTTAKWSNVTTIIGTTGTSVGTGSGNTWSIVNQSGYTGTSAAKYCTQLSISGYTDWFLPSLDELHLMRLNLYLYNVGNFSTTGYWCSSEVDSTLAWREILSTGVQDNTKLKSQSYSYRACRKF